MIKPSDFSKKITLHNKNGNGYEYTHGKYKIGMRQFKSDVLFIVVVFKEDVKVKIEQFNTNFREGILAYICEEINIGSI